MDSEAAKLAAKIRGVLDHRPRRGEAKTFDRNDDGTVDIHPSRVSAAVTAGHVVIFTRETAEQMLAFLESRP